MLPEKACLYLSLVYFALIMSQDHGVYRLSSPEKTFTFYKGLLLMFLVVPNSSSLMPVAAYVSPFPGFLQSRKRKNIRLGKCPLNMALTPIGPFCPFRSTAAQDLDPKMEAITEAADGDFATEMSRFQLDLQMEKTPHPERLLRVANGIDAAVNQWENLITRLKISQDFQTREYAKLTQAHLSNHGVTSESVASMMRWQSGCMRAMSNNTPPPMPPPDLNLEEMMRGANADKSPPSVSTMVRAEQITSNPFEGNEKHFESPQVKGEYESLCGDHIALIEFGGKYDTFDPLGKLRFLDEIEKIEERWDVFFTRFSLMGALNEKYVEQCNTFLASMGMDEESYRRLLKKCHQIMKEDAETERNRIGL